MKLTRDDLYSALWKKLSEHIVEQIDLLRRKNDGGLDPIPTARLRGQIAGLKHVLSLADPEEDQPAPVADNGE